VGVVALIGPRQGVEPALSDASGQARRAPLRADADPVPDGTR